MVQNLDTNTVSLVSTKNWLEVQRGKTHRHDALKRSRLPSRGPVEALELVIAPKMIQEEAEELM